MRPRTCCLFAHAEANMAMTVVLLLALPPWAPAQDTELTTLGRMNGRFWKLMSSNDKAFFLKGMVEGGILVRDAIELQGGSTGGKQSAPIVFKIVADTVDSTFITHFKANEVAVGIDTFYADPANIRIPISLAYGMVKFKFEGMQDAELQQRISLLRKMAQAMGNDDGRRQGPTAKDP